jgi:NADPH:quinone reductase-like Zn-dependent oxidoreductase
VNKWYDHATAGERRVTFEQLFELARRKLLRTKVERVYSLGEFHAAVAHAARAERAGKIIFRILP